MTNDITIAEYEIASTTDLDYLLGSLRSHIGDIVSPYSFSDGFLRRLLVDSFNSLGYRWQFRYVIDRTYAISRNISSVFKFGLEMASSPTIIKQDERPIILQAAIILRGGNLTNNALLGNIGSWRDDEISLSNISGVNASQSLILRDQSELDSILPPRDRKLARTKKGSLFGYEDGVNAVEGYK